MTAINLPCPHTGGGGALPFLAYMGMCRWTRFQSSLQLIPSEWKMTDQQGKKIYQGFFVAFLEIFPGFSASSGDQRKLLFGNQ